MIEIPWSEKGYVLCQLFHGAEEKKTNVTVDKVSFQLSEMEMEASVSVRNIPNKL